MTGPNPLRVLWSILRARRLKAPQPAGSSRIDHQALGGVLAALSADGIGALKGQAATLQTYINDLASVDPDDLDRSGALAYWINLYNAGALDLARRSLIHGAPTVLRTPGGFNSPIAEVAGEDVSLDGIEHGKIRRFGDPRIHSALVCGSVSCPTLRHEPYEGDEIDTQLDLQMQSFLSTGGAIADESDNTLRLSRVMLWYGSDFARPHRMPTLLPARKGAVAAALRPWFSAELRFWWDADRRRVRFQSYDWNLACSVNR